MIESFSSPNRREFLKAGSGAVLAVALGAVPVAASTGAASPLASVGYWSGVAKIARRFRSASLRDVVRAESVLTGDPSFFAAGARVAVRGFWSPAARDQSVGLDVLYDVEGRRVPFHAWSAGKGAAVAAAPVEFNVPVDALRTVEMLLTVAGQQQPISFSVNSMGDALKLRPGFYFVALHGSAPGATVDWSRIRIREGVYPNDGASGEGVLTASDGFNGEQPVSFSYLVMRVDVAVHQDS